MITKKVFSKLFCLLFIVCILFGLASINLYSYNSGLTAYADEITVNEDFAEDSVIAVLTKDATRQFLDYTEEDFKEVNAIAVYDLTAETVGWVEKQVLGIPTQEKMLINVEKFRRTLKIEIPENNKENVLNAISILEQREDVESASPNYILKTCAVSNDSKRSSQWGLDNISVNQAWDISTGTNEVLVGVIDSGIDASHIDLTDNIHRSSPHTLETTLHRDFTTGTADGIRVLEPEDQFGHGTHVAGIIGVKGNNAEGCAGVAWNIDLVSLRVFDENGNGYLSDVKEAIQYAAKCNIKILNYSGGGYDSIDGLIDQIDSYEGLLICAAGNGGEDWIGDNNDEIAYYPANYDCDNIISIGSIDEGCDRSSFSNYGKTSVDLFAPGGSILSTYPSSMCTGEIRTTRWGQLLACECKWSTKYVEAGEWIPNGTTHHSNGYHYMSGTSMAAPFVTGTAALILSEYPELTASQIKEVILNNVAIEEGNNRLAGLCVTEGRLDAFKALSNVYITENNGAKITGTSFTPEEELNIPSAINGVTVTSIGSQAFSGCTNLESITIPATITSIGANAF